MFDFFKSNNAKGNAAPKYGVHLKLRIAANVAYDFCGKRMSPEEVPTVKAATSLYSYDNTIQKAEATLIVGPQELWFHHGPSSFATTPNMIVDIGHKFDQLSFKIVGEFFSLETTYSQICIFYAPVDKLYELMNNGHLGYVGSGGKEREVTIPNCLGWIEPIHECIGGGLTNEKLNGITATYTNEAVELTINGIYELGEHQQIPDD